MSSSTLPLREALRALLREQVGAALATRRRLGQHLDQGLVEARAQADRLAADLARNAHLVESLGARLDRRAFGADMSMAQVLDRHGGAAAVLARHDLPACGDCAVRFDETLEEAAQAYGLPLSTLLAELNALLPPPLAAVGGSP